MLTAVMARWRRTGGIECLTFADCRSVEQLLGHAYERHLGVRHDRGRRYRE
jgi:hypothetical protein